MPSSTIARYSLAAPSHNLRDTHTMETLEPLERWVFDEVDLPETSPSGL